MSAGVYNGSGPAAATPPLTPIRITRAQFRALSEYHQAVALVYLRRGTGEVELIEDDAKQSLGATGA